MDHLSRLLMQLTSKEHGLVNHFNKKNLKNKKSNIVFQLNIGNNTSLNRDKKQISFFFSCITVTSILFLNFFWLINHLQMPLWRLNIPRIFFF